MIAREHFATALPRLIGVEGGLHADGGRVHVRLEFHVCKDNLGAGKLPGLAWSGSLIRGDPGTENSANPPIGVSRRPPLGLDPTFASPGATWRPRAKIGTLPSSCNIIRTLC
jgi:hypothetical protein